MWWLTVKLKQLMSLQSDTSFLLTRLLLFQRHGGLTRFLHFWFYFFQIWKWCHPVVVLCMEFVLDRGKEAAQVGCVLCNVFVLSYIVILIVNDTKAWLQLSPFILSLLVFFSVMKHFNLFSPGQQCNNHKNYFLIFCSRLNAEPFL